MGWEYLWILAVVAAVLSAVGFYKFVYFLSIGYGYAIAGIGVALMLIFGKQMEAVHFVQCVLFIAYGMRLSGFLLYREIRNALYRKTLAEATTSEATMPIFVKGFIWLWVAALYVAQTCPVFYRQYNCAVDTLLPWIGVLISVAALILETVADLQKSAQKKKDPNMVATEGLYKICRCPNYFGEILFWTGVFVGGLTALSGIGQWLMAVLAYIAIVYIMFNGAQRLEKRQIGRYGKLPEYNAYADRTPIIIPLLPVYHLTKADASEKGETK